MKYRVNIMDRENDYEIMMRIIISEEQKTSQSSLFRGRNFRRMGKD